MLCQVILLVGMVSNVPYVQHRHTTCSKVSHVDMWAEINECKSEPSCTLSATKDVVYTVWRVGL